MTRATHCGFYILHDCCFVGVCVAVLLFRCSFSIEFYSVYAVNKCACFSCVCLCIQNAPPVITHWYDWCCCYTRSVFAILCVSVLRISCRTTYRHRTCNGTARKNSEERKTQRNTQKPNYARQILSTLCTWFDLDALDLTFLVPLLLLLLLLEHENQKTLLNILRH